MACDLTNLLDSLFDLVRFRNSGDRKLNKPIPLLTNSFEILYTSLLFQSESFPWTVSVILVAKISFAFSMSSPSRV